MKKLALALTLTGAAAFSTNALAMGCDYSGDGYKHTFNDADKKHEAVFADSDATDTSKTATQKK